jgi:starch synthase
MDVNHADSLGQQRLRIAMVASECVPYAKTGGLADVIGALPKTLKAMGHDVLVVIPKYGSIDVVRHNLRRFYPQMGVWMGGTEEWCAVDTTRMEGDVPVYFIESNKYFGRSGLYHDVELNDYSDNPQRFAFLTRAALQLCHAMRFDADIIHIHDWQTALASAYLKIWHWNDAVLGKAASVLTIHNIGYQGVYPAENMNYLGLQWSNFTPEKLEDHGNVNFLKGGIVYADLVNTVSPTYADETRTPEFAHGLAPYLNNKGTDYLGILNGVDYTEWDPETDPLIPARYSRHDMRGKAVCKEALQRRFGLDIDPEIPIIGVISRFVGQKGLDVLAACIKEIVSEMPVQFVILGSGDPVLEKFYADLAWTHAGLVGSFIGYSNELAHWIEAGSDFFIMPSRYEPCGLNQIYSLRYGTLPIVRNTGGLADTVEQYDERIGGGTGFKFNTLSPEAVYYVVGWAVSTWYDRRSHIGKMRRKGMIQDFSWEESARAYLRAYQQAIDNK